MPKPRQIYALCDPRAQPPVVCYVGASTQPDIRLKEHICEAVRVLVQDLPDSLKVQWVQELLRINLQPLVVTLEVVPDGEDWGARERFWINGYRSEHLTNVSSGGQGGLPGRTLSEVHRLKISAANRVRDKPLGLAQRVSAANTGRKRTAEQLDARATTRKPVSPETRALLSLRATGREHTPEAKQRMSVAQKGRKVSQETRVLLSSLKTGVKQTEEHKQKAAATRRGKPRSPETRARIASALKGKPFTQERLEHISQAQKARWAKVKSSQTTLEQETES